MKACLKGDDTEIHYGVHLVIITSSTRDDREYPRREVSCFPITGTNRIVPTYRGQRNHTRARVRAGAAAALSSVAEGLAVSLILRPHRQFVSAQAHEGLGPYVRWISLRQTPRSHAAKDRGKTNFGKTVRSQFSTEVEVQSRRDASH